VRVVVVVEEVVRGAGVVRGEGARGQKTANTETYH
jgi:hypothetical protein